MGLPEMLHAMFRVQRQHLMQQSAPTKSYKIYKLKFSKNLQVMVLRQSTKY